MSYFKNNSDWKELTAVYTKVGGQWKKVTESFAKVNGVWKQTTFASAPEQAPQLTWHGYGQFRITNYDSSLYYEARYVGGSGSASRSGNIYTLNGQTSAFEVVSKYFAEGSPSPPGYMERRRITYTFIPQCRYIQRTCFRTINEDYPATPRIGTRTGDESNCAVHICPGGLFISGPDGANNCFCTNFTTTTIFVGQGACPTGWYNCGNKCCVDGQIVGYDCPSGGSLSGTTCIRRRQEPYECGYWESCNNKNPTPSGYNESGGEWWRTSR